PAGTSSSGKIARAGHSGSHNVQSMHSSGSIARKFGPSWKQSTGHTSTQSVYLHFTQLSVTTKAMGSREQLISSIWNDRTYSTSIEAIVVKSQAMDGRSGQPRARLARGAADGNEGTITDDRKNRPPGRNARGGLARCGFARLSPDDWRSGNHG